MRRTRAFLALLAAVVIGPAAAMAQPAAAPPAPGVAEIVAPTKGAAEAGKKRKMPWEQKDELTYFEPTLTPWPPLPPDMSFEDLMDEFLASKNLTEESREGPVPTPDWDRQHLIMGELFKMRRAVVVPKLLSVMERRDKDWLRIAVELSTYFKDASVIAEVTKVAGDLKLPADTRKQAVVTLGRVRDAQTVNRLQALYAKEPDASVRSVIIEQFDMVGDDAAIPFLCQQSKADKDVNVRVSATFALVNFDRDASVDCLIAATRSKDAAVRETAAKVLSRTAGAAAAAAMKDRPGIFTPHRLAMIKRAREAVGPLLSDPDAKVRVAAARALYDLGDETSLPYMEKALKERGSTDNKDLEMKEVLIELLARIRPHVNDPEPEDHFLPIPTEKVLPILVRELETEPERLSYVAARSLGYTESEKAIDALEKALASSPSQVVRVNAAQALGNIKSDRAVLALSEAAPKADSRVQYAIAEALSRVAAPRPKIDLDTVTDTTGVRPAPPPPAPVKPVASPYPAAITALMGLAKQGDANFRANALSLLGEAKDPAAIPVLRAALNDKDPVVKASAIRGLGNLVDRSAIPDLKHALDDPMPQIRGAALNALAEFQDPTVTPYMARLLNDPVEANRSLAIDTLERNRDPKAVRYMIKRYKEVRDDHDFAILVGMSNIMGAAADAGRAIEPGSPDDAVPLLQDQMFEPNWQKRLASMFGIGRLHDKRGVPALRELLKDTVVDVRVSSLDTLGLVGADDKLTIQAIKELRKRGDDRWVRDIAIVNLLRLGDQETIDEVVKQAKTDEDPERRQYAIMYIQESDNPKLIPALMDMLDDTDEIGLAISSIGLVPGGPPYYEASSGLYPKVQEYVVGAIRKLSGNGHPAIDLAPKAGSPFYGIFETRVERAEKIKELRRWWDENKEKVLSAPPQPPPYIIKLPPKLRSSTSPPSPQP